MAPLGGSKSGIFSPASMFSCMFAMRLVGPSSVSGLVPSIVPAWCNPVVMTSIAVLVGWLPLGSLSAAARVLCVMVGSLPRPYSLILGILLLLEVVNPSQVRSKWYQLLLMYSTSYCRVLWSTTYPCAVLV